MKTRNALHRWLLSLILLAGYLSLSAQEKEKEYVLFLSSVSEEEAWIHGFLNELRGYFPYEEKLGLQTYFLTVPVLQNKEEVKQAQQDILQAYSRHTLLFTRPCPVHIADITGQISSDASKQHTHRGIQQEL